MRGAFCSSCSTMENKHNLISKNPQPVTPVESLEFHLQSGDYLLFVGYILNFARGELEDKKHGNVLVAIDLLKRVRADLVYVNQRWVLVQRGVWGTVREQTTVVLASIFGKIFMMKKTKKEFEWKGDYRKKHGANPDALGELNVDGFNKILENQKELKEDTKRNEKEIAELKKQIVGLKEQNDQMMDMLKDISKRL